MVGSGSVGDHAGMRVLRAGVAYFALVFAAGFVLGAVRVPLLVPRLGERTAELLELPFMGLVVVLVSRWRQRRTPELSPSQQLGVGGFALLLLLTAECALGAVLQGRSPIEVLLAHDPVSGSVYYVLLVVFALLPWWWSRRVSRCARPHRRRS